jgi:ribose-phosphate pyrophosphokinase
VRSAPSRWVISQGRNGTRCALTAKRLASKWLNEGLADSTSIRASVIHVCEGVRARHNQDLRPFGPNTGLRLSRGSGLGERGRYPRSVMEEFLAGSASQRLGAAVTAYLDTPLGRSETLRFSEGNLFVRVLENVRGRDTYIIQSTAFPANDNFMELLFWIDALKRASAASVTAVIPYFTYAKGDKKDEPRVSIRARVCADAIEPAGVDRVVTMDLHAPQVQGFFKRPVDDLHALPVLVEAIRAKGLKDLVVVAPDAGFAKRARLWADRLAVPLAIADKRRTVHSETAEIMEVIGNVDRKTVLIVDDFTISAGTLCDAARVLAERGASEIYAAVSHGLLAPPAGERLEASPIRTLFMTDTVETQPIPLIDKVEVVSVAGLFGEAIRRIARRESISVLFE